MKKEWDEVMLWALAEQLNQRAEELQAANAVKQPHEISDPIERLVHLVASQKPMKPFYTGNVLPFRARCLGHATGPEQAGPGGEASR